MLFDFNLNSTLLLIPFLQGLIYGILFFLRWFRFGDIKDLFLGTFIFLGSFFLCPWMLGFAGWYDTHPYKDILLYVPFQNLFLFGPIVFFYTKNLFYTGMKSRLKYYLHYVPGICYIIYSLYLFLYDKFIYGDYYYYADGTDKDFDEWYQYTGFLSMGIYLIKATRLYLGYSKLIVQLVSFADAILHKWIRYFLFAFLSMIIIKLVFLVITSLHPELDSYIGNWWFYIFISFILFYISIVGFSNHENVSLVYKRAYYIKGLENPKNVTFIQNNRNIGISNETKPKKGYIKEHKEKIIKVMEEESPYLDPGLTLYKFSKMIDINTSDLSRAINQGFDMNFNDFINKYRVIAVKTRFLEGRTDNMTLLGIAYDCGFNSKTTFNRAFKKNTDMTPRQFLKENTKKG
ncbi:MAG: helix-turn-helix domain-containing protein [Bacteroidota bacterium]